MSEKRCELIITIVSRGFTESVMDAAKRNGATGGTILHARGTGAKEIEKFFGVTITPEKEVVLLLVKAQDSAGIMKAICRDAGLMSQAHGLSFSLPVDGVVGNAAFEALFEDENR